MSNYSLTTWAKRKLQQAPPCTFIIFGATGDLTARKLLPALYHVLKEGYLPPHFACVGFARRPKSEALFQQEMKEAVARFSRTPLEEGLWEQFAETLFYHQSQFDDDQGYLSLKKRLDAIDKQYGTLGNRLYYLAVPPNHVEKIIAKLSMHRLLYPASEQTKWSKVIIEKPFGTDLHTAQALDMNLRQYLLEQQIYRIDHYLGKETVQNLLVFRFANPLFEAFWNNHYIDHVQITVAEDLGVELRGSFFETVGILRDVIQNHMMQLISLVAMEPPINLEAESIRNEKVKVLEALRPFDLRHLDTHSVRGQYASGFIQGTPVVGYRDEANVDPASPVETFAAIKLYIDNWRWANIPFYLRAGKRMPKRATEIAILFKKMPGILFSKKNVADNALVIRIQPDEGIALKMNCKVPGPAGPIQPVKMDFHYSSYFGCTPPEAYERLLFDAMCGDTTLFARNDEVMASWNILSPVVDHWRETPPRDFPNYTAGSWGPVAANMLMQATGRKWRYL